MTALPFRPLIASTLSLLAFHFCASHQTVAQDAKPDPNITAAARPVGILTHAEWKDLFNGKDLSGWAGDTNGYTVENGILVCKKGGKNLYTASEYSDFALQFDFKLEESGNNGIGIRVPMNGHPSRDGMEIQILDHDGKAYHGDAVMADGKTQRLSWLKPWQYHGSVYGIVPAKIGYLKPVGEWNTQTIIVIEDHVQVILNGAVIVDAFLDNLTPVDGSPHPGMKNRKGHIALAGHDDRVEFRNLKLVDYATSPTKPASSSVNEPPTGFTTLFNGKDLTGWKGLAHENANQR
ncbi:MAG: DUF1080 domain-containing protein, partial [Planctomycetaceae bacterium]|nr:DUF1080 domain-containing protein [Planctomycetaceae bacterium]